MTKTCATYDDVDLVIRLYELRREEKLREAREWFASSFESKTVKDFNKLCPAGSDQAACRRGLPTAAWRRRPAAMPGRH